MSSIVTSILSSTLGLLWNKAHDATAKSLKDGDVTDAKIREIVVRELNDIKTKLDGLSRKDLLSSYMFLKEGVQLLIDSLDKSKDEQKAVMNEDKDDGSVTSSTMPSGSDILNDALQLSQAMEKLNIVSNQSEIAKERFKRAREQGTFAFFNEALSIEDRIFATKLRVVSEILECLDSPNSAITSCLLFLEQIHDLSAVREMFSVYLSGGVKSILGKTERAENIKSVMMTNYVLYQFVQKFSSQYCAAFNWPVIQLDDRSFNPIWSWGQVFMRTSWGNELKSPPNEVATVELIYPYTSAVNSRGEIIVADNDVGHVVRIISKTGKTKLFLPLPVLRSQDEDGNKIKHFIEGVAVDEENNVYLIVFYYKENQHHAVLLYVFDEHCNHVKQKRELNFLLKTINGFLPLAVNKNKDIVMTGEEDVYVCDVTGQLKYKFKPKCCPEVISVSQKNEIIIGSQEDNIVEIYTEEGNFKTSIGLPAGQEVIGVTFHFGINKIIVLGFDKEKDSYYLHCYSETGEHPTSTCLNDTTYYSVFYYNTNIKSHLSGPAAILTEISILYV